MSKMLGVSKPIATFSTKDGSVVVNLRFDDSFRVVATGFKDHSPIVFDEGYDPEIFRDSCNFGKPASQK